MSKRIVRLGNSLVGWITGGLAHAVVLASAFFGALSGSSPATTAAIGSVLIPEMKERGFPADFVAGLQAVAGALGTIIPPSIPMIVYGVLTGTSIGDLFIAGIIPGLTLALFLMITAYREARRRGIRQTSQFSVREVGASVVDSIPALLVPVIILGGIYGGIFTATEAGAVATVYGFLASWLFYRELTWEKVKSIMAGSIANTILVTALIAVSGAFSWVLAAEGVGQAIGSSVASIASTRITFLLAANIVFLLAGCFIETVSGILIFTPILFPIAMRFGIDPVHFGIIIVVNMSLGMATPPVGENQYIAAAIAGVPFEQEVKAALPFLAAGLLALVAITYVPQLSLWLPAILK